MESPFRKEDKKERQRCQAKERYYIKKVLLGKQGSKCFDCWKKTTVRLVRVRKNSSQLKESDYRLLCHACIVKRQEEQKRAYKPRSDVFTGKSQTGFFNFIRERVFERDGRKCVWCDSKQAIGLGSLIPLSRGGKLTFNNYVTTCQHCRPSKGNKLPLQFIDDGIAINEYLHGHLDHALKVDTDPGRYIKITFYLFAEVTQFLHKLTNNKSVSSQIRTRAEQLNIKLLS